MSKHIDRTRTATAKARDIARRNDRRTKSTRLFLALAFPADLGVFAPANAR